MTNWLFLPLLVLATLLTVGRTEESLKKGKVLGLFNVIKFKNEVCEANGKNGTCYTSSECSVKGGTNDGSCAQGFGVCCTFNLNCGARNSENATYLDSSQATATELQHCSYRICPMSSDICRIRFDFKTFSLSGPATDSTGGATTGLGDAIGDCTTDSFSITSPGMKGSPVICGVNTGQHMILDVSSQCLTASFLTRSQSPKWNIYVTQYACGSEIAGPTGCLQFFTADTAIFSSFNYQATKPEHLSNQNYDICIRRSKGNCKVCFQEYSSNPLVKSFGLSLMATTSKVDTDCSTLDYISIHGASSTTVGAGLPDLVRNCGTVFGTVDATGTLTTTLVCTSQTPFRVTFNTNGGEDTTGTDSATNEVAAEANVGFQLKYTQTIC